MKFGPVCVAEAEGGIVAHALVLPDRRLKKGHVLTAPDVEDLKRAGLDRITIARLGDHDVEENEAAHLLAGAIAGGLITTAEAFTGRVNLYAGQSGIFTANQAAVDRINRVASSITLATLADSTWVEAGRMVATVKIIPFAVESELTQQVVAEVDVEPVIGLVAAQALNIGLIATRLPSLKPSTMDKTARILNDRLGPSGSTVVVEQRIDHDALSVATALSQIIDRCDLVIVFGASAITDSQDVIPAGIEQAGGIVQYFGMPVDPGNLLLLAEMNAKTVIGAPGCARSPAENGFDWVLQRLLCGLPVDEAYLSGLGVGGLLMEISARPQPREG